MIGASFVLLFFWLFVIFAVCAALTLVAEWHEGRERRRRVERLRERRAYLDSVEPKRWDDRSAA